MSATAPPARAAPPASARRAGAHRSSWLKTLRQWHWISSALCLTGLLLFSITGVTLNHASQIEANPKVVTRDAQLPPALRVKLAAASSVNDERNAPLPAELRRWLKEQLAIDVGARAAEWSKEEVYLALPRPGGDAWVRVDRASGAVDYESTDRGWISYLNDLHKGRNSGAAWGWFIDLFAVACLVFSITGLFILKMHAAQRTSTWPIVGLGLLVPLLLALLLVH